MIGLIIEKELREMLGSRKFQLSFLVCSLLIILTFYVGSNNHRLNAARHEAALRENLRKMEGVTDWTEVRNTRIFLPPGPLESLVCGVSNDIGRTIEVSGGGELVNEDSRYNENPVFAIFRFLDLEFIFQIVLSLFAILFVFDAVNGEKERGTLRLAFANPLPRDRYIIGKWAGTMLAVCVPMVVPILIGCLILPLTGVPMSGGEWLRLAIIITAGIFFFSVFVTLSLFLSTMTAKSSDSFLMLLVVWIFAVLIIPRSAVLLAGSAVEVPSVDEIEAQKTRYREQLFMEDLAKMDGFKPTETEDVDKIMDEFNEFMEKIHEERDEKMQALADRLDEDRRNRQAVQQAYAFNIARISPSASFSLAATRLAGTSLALKKHFIDEAYGYQKSYCEFIEDKTGMSPRGGMVTVKIDDGVEEETTIDPMELPSFDYHPGDLKTDARGAAVDLGLLLLFNIVFFAGAYAAFMRYDVR